MTTKKPTAKQLAARKRFAAMARSGAFKRKAAKAKAAKAMSAKGAQMLLTTAPAKKRAPAKKAVVARKTAKRRTSRKANPMRHTRVAAPSCFEVRRVATNGGAGSRIASFDRKQDAIDYARAYVKAKGVAVAIHGRK